MPGDPGCGVIIFLRYPEEGKVKTRIAGELGNAKALAIYKELTALTFQLASELPFPVYLYYDKAGIGKEAHPDFNVCLQQDGDLGSKIHSALSDVLQKHSKAIIIGSDCPLLSEKEIHQASNLLAHYDYVIGPTTDGGYYLLACKEPDQELFKEMPWSTGQVLTETLQRIKSLGKTCTLLSVLYDVDTAQDWERYINKSTHS